VTQAALIPGKHLLAAYSAAQQLVAIWSTESWKLRASVPVGRAGALVLDPDESSLVAVVLPEDEESWGGGKGASKLIFIDPATDAVDHEVRVGEVNRAAFSPDGKRLALLGLDGTLQIRSADGRRELRRPVRLNGQPLALAWRPDGALIAVSVDETGVVLVDPRTGKVSAPLPDETSMVFRLAWSPDGRFLATSPSTESEDGEGFEPEPSEIWTLAAPQLQRRMCRLAGGPIGRRAWAQLVDSELPHRGLCRAHVALPSSPERDERPVLGSMAFAPGGLGWGRAEPERLFNGGDPSGDIAAIHWRDWGGDEAIGFGQTSVFKPSGGYYPNPAKIELRAHGIGRCGLQRAYTKLSVRIPPRPHARFGPWASWSGVRTLCGGAGH